LKALARIITLFLFSFIFSKSIAQGYLEFVENKGQWDQQIQFKGNLTTGAFALKADGGYKILLYNPADLTDHAGHANKSENSGGTTIKKIQSISNKTSANLSTTTNNNLRGHVYEINFLNANPSPIAVPDKPIKTYNNYFIGNDPKKWASHCQVFNAVTYQDIYPKIDVRYYSDQGKLKYDFIVHPGGDPNQIALYFTGADGLKINEGNLVIKNTAQDITELKPTTYQITSIGKKEISSSYDLKGNIVRFQLNEPVNPKETLVIDPLIFSTFTGSIADNWGYTATYDNKGNFYAGGTVFDQGFPVSVGAFQSAFKGPKGGTDIAIMKFNASGSDRVYATYIGGSTGSEQPHSLVVDANNNLVIAGRTNSVDYPGNRLGSGGKWDIVLTKLNGDGSNLIGSRIIGGAENDGVNIREKSECNASVGPCYESILRNYGDDARSEVIVDAADNIYLTASTQSTNFPVANAAFPNLSPSAGTRSQDAVVLKFNPNLTTALFSTYLGGSNDDAGFVLALNPSNNDIYVGGATASTDFPGDKTGTVGATYNGDVADGFIAIFNNAGVLKKSSFFGSSGVDIIYGIQFDKFSFPYIMGTTTGIIATTPGVYAETGGKQFITKLNQNLSSIIFSTNFGTNSSIPNISPTAFLIDRCENMYVSGWGGDANKRENYVPSAGTKGMTAVPGPDQVSLNTDGSDFYFIVLSKDASTIKYGSFYGQVGGTFPDHVDGGTSRFDRNGIIYQSVCANCGGGTKFPTTAGAWSVNNGSQSGGYTGCNLAAIKIAFNLAGVGTDLVTSINGRVGDTTGCVPLTVVFEDSLAMGKTYIWDYNDGSKRDTTLAPKTSHVFNNVGFYRVKLISIDSTSCNIADSSIVNIRVRNDAAILNFKPTKVGACNSLTYDFSNISIPPSSPAKPFAANSFLWIFGDGTTKIAGTQTVTHTYATAGTYDVKLILTDTNYCNKFDSLDLQLHIAANVKAQFQTPAVGCVPYTALFNNTSLGGLSFIWDFGDGSPTSTLTNPTHIYATVGTYQVTLIANDPSTCNLTDTTKFSLSVISKPTAGYYYSPQPTIPNTAVVFNNISIGGVFYKWVFGDGDSVITSKKDTTISHIYPATGVYNACQIVFNAGGCSDTTCQQISVTINPGCDVPNAFTPNSDGTNDRIFVRGYGIAQMTWRIYDRWGNMVYASADPSQGWDGTFNGKLLAQDVYHYTLQVVFSDKVSFVKKGDITLLR
jgi:gliding motility-associated-like protein